MLDAETVAQQEQLLAIYRRTVAQLAAGAGRYGGETAAPPEVAHGLYEAREQIRQIKAVLRQNGLSIDDMPNDEPLTRKEANAAPQRTGGGAQGVFISGGTVSGTIVGVNTGSITTHSGNMALGDALSTIRAALQHIIQAAQQADAHDFADDLEDVARILAAAAKAQAEGKVERYAAKLLEARRALELIAPGAPQLQPIAQALSMLSA